MSRPPSRRWSRTPPWCGPPWRTRGWVGCCSAPTRCGPRAQWSARVGRAQGLAPLLTALSGSSAFLAGRDTGWHSARQRAWSGLGELRAGRLPDLADPVEAWAERALDAEVVLVPAGDDA